MIRSERIEHKNIIRKMRRRGSNLTSKQRNGGIWIDQEKEKEREELSMISRSKVRSGGGEKKGQRREIEGSRKSGSNRGGARPAKEGIFAL